MIDGAEITYEETGAYLLGSEMIRIAKPASRRIVTNFLQGIPDEYARPISQILHQEGRISEPDARRRTLYRLFKVFAAAVMA
jgi:hypothetical protein